MFWRDHELCGPSGSMPSRFWGPEEIDHQAWIEFSARLDPGQELEILLEALSGARKVLDVGGGTGTLTREIARRFGKVTVVEPSAAQSSRIQALPGSEIELRPGRAEAIPGRDGEFDAVMATWVLQYTEDPFVAVAEMARLCADEPGARVLILQAAPWNDIVRLYNAEASAARLPPAHHGFLLAGAADALETSGFRQITLSVCPASVRVPDDDAAVIASTLQRLHFAGHSTEAAMLAATTPLIRDMLAKTPGMLNDDGVLLVARR